MSKRQYVDFHIIQTVPPANLNRDDQGNPKEAQFGGARRARVSSQAWKRATRQAFDDKLPKADHSTRTKRIAGQLAERVESRTGVEAEAAARIAGALLEPLGIKAGKKAGDTAYLLFFGYRQLDDIVDLIADQAKTLADLDDEQLKTATKDLPVADRLKSGHPMGVALFGRMVADIPSLNVDAATQVAHAISTHPVELESDYYTAVDDENEADESGAGMIGNVGFNAATLYRYATVGVHQLAGNLGSVDAAIEAVGRFAEAFALSMPTGHINSFAHRTRPSLVAVVVRDDQPVNLVSAFERPIRDSDGIASTSAARLAREYQRSTQQWGDTPAHVAVSHAFDNDGPLTAAFGANQSVSQLLSGLNQALTASWKTN
ncbi:type I-E CRISPR-associated protein Cas7/Cse4/CasC [Microbispora cellulosiformans]|uniref:Type I-E CRISPR-associated protein Cas7/Cse4/CasC n=1 Tax=Microbispora cellulosiformans TaxID=2614688 RepID=A0A5J5JXI3_9ACTN|nr:type I-E CRISPR-associated protein Cas7/Cse4/CasC [Microbispora cellulosiformans]KAA9376255.1 type I-E CRISPR-associated protein Cas7/Cse4/CasC [Microbispora cellulosiformans]